MRECLPHLCGNTEIERRKAIADLVQERLFDLGEKLETQLQNEFNNLAQSLLIYTFKLTLALNKATSFIIYYFCLY
uniref:BHLH domain-containing protein n=1 Tax=Ascaris lumbricoides TaxID=6252 RepID=A0A0M3IX64_ASCLU